MGLYSIAIRDTKAAAEIPAILKQHGYDVQFKNENDGATIYVCRGKRHELTFWITKQAQRRFSIGAGREGTALLRILGAHDIFAVSNESGGQSAR